MYPAVRVQGGVFREARRHICVVHSFAQTIQVSSFCGPQLVRICNQRGYLAHFDKCSQMKAFSQFLD